VRVHPALVPTSHPLANVRGSFNAVFVEAESAGELMFYGRGAGGAPTASAVLGDVVSAARHRVLGGKGPQESTYAELAILPPSAALTRYQVRLEVDDRPGVLAQVAQALAAHGVSIEAVRQPGTPEATEPVDGGAAGPAVAQLVITTHTAPESALAATVEAVAGLEPVRTVTSVLRVEGA
jgi:homoserine dehydrogenase